MELVVHAKNTDVAPITSLKSIRLVLVDCVELFLGKFEVERC